MSIDSDKIDIDALHMLNLEIATKADDESGVHSGPRGPSRRHLHRDRGRTEVSQRAALRAAPLIAKGRSSGGRTSRSPDTERSLSAAC